MKLTKKQASAITQAAGLIGESLVRLKHEAERGDLASVAKVAKLIHGMAGEMASTTAMAYQFSIAGTKKGK